MVKLKTLNGKKESTLLILPTNSQLTHIERNISMNFSKNIGMLLLGIWLIVSGVVALVPAVFFNGLGTIMAILAVLAGIFILLRK
jgi:uncharacterized membrane protein